MSYQSPCQITEPVLGVCSLDSVLVCTACPVATTFDRGNNFALREYPGLHVVHLYEPLAGLRMAHTLRSLRRTSLMTRGES